MYKHHTCFRSFLFYIKIDRGLLSFDRSELYHDIELVLQDVESFHLESCIKEVYFLETTVIGCLVDIDLL